MASAKKNPKKKTTKPVITIIDSDDEKDEKTIDPEFADESELMTATRALSSFDASNGKRLLTEIKAWVDIGIIAAIGIKPDDAIGFGLKNSHVYREILLKLLSDEGMGKSEFAALVALFTMVKNKTRVLQAMVKFSKEAWYAKVRAFIENRVVQYNSQKIDDFKTFPAIQIPHVLPTLTALIWRHLHPKSTSKEFLSNLWACQMKLPDDMKTKQRAWEEDFWNNKVQYTRNQEKNVFAGRFVLGFWMTKASDTYPFLDNTGKEIFINTEADLDSWLAL